MIENNKNYIVYQLTMTSSGKFTPPLELQIERIKQSFKERFGVEATQTFLGPIKQGDQVFIQEGQYAIQVPNPVIIKHILEGYNYAEGFATPSGK